MLTCSRPPGASTGPSVASSAQQSPALLLDGDFMVISVPAASRGICPSTRPHLSSRPSRASPR